MHYTCLIHRLSEDITRGSAFERHYHTLDLSSRQSAYLLIYYLALSVANLLIETTNLTYEIRMQIEIKRNEKKNKMTGEN